VRGESLDRAQVAKARKLYAREPAPLVVRRKTPRHPGGTVPYRRAGGHGRNSIDAGLGSDTLGQAGFYRVNKR